MNKFHILSNYIRDIEPLIFKYLQIDDFKKLSKLNKIWYRYIKKKLEKYYNFFDGSETIFMNSKIIKKLNYKCNYDLICIIKDADIMKYVLDFHILNKLKTYHLRCIVKFSLEAMYPIYYHDTLIHIINYTHNYYPLYANNNDTYNDSLLTSLFLLICELGNLQSVKYFIDKYPVIYSNITSNMIKLAKNKEIEMFLIMYKDIKSL